MKFKVGDKVKGYSGFFHDDWSRDIGTIAFVIKDTPGTNYCFDYIVDFGTEIYDEGAGRLWTHDCDGMLKGPTGRYYKESDLCYHITEDELKEEPQVNTQEFVVLSQSDIEDYIYSRHHSFDGASEAAVKLSNDNDERYVILSVVANTERPPYVVKKT